MSGSVEVSTFLCFAVLQHCHTSTSRSDQVLTVHCAEKPLRHGKNVGQTPYFGLYWDVLRRIARMRAPPEGFFSAIDC